LLIKAHAFFTTYAAHLRPTCTKIPQRSLVVRKQLADALHRFADRDPPGAVRADRRAAARLLRRAAGRPLHARGSTPMRSGGRVSLVLCVGYSGGAHVVLAPLYLFGLLTNYVPYILPSLVFKASRLDSGVQGAGADDRWA
jgi:uncharacterized membrane protein YccC